MTAYPTLLLHGQAWKPFVCVFDNSESFVFYAKDKEHAENQMGPLAIRPHRIDELTEVESCPAK